MIKICIIKESISMDSKKKSEDRYIEVKKYIEDAIVEIEKMRYYPLREICLFSLLDQFIQNKYPEKTTCKNCENFCLFLDEYLGKEKEFQWLKAYDPIIFRYDNQITQIFEIDTSDFEIYPYPTVDLYIKSYKLDIIVAKYRFDNLLYKWRNKLVHECRQITTASDSMQEISKPIYFKCGEKIKLFFPYYTIKNLVIKAILNYLEDCKIKELDPFYNYTEYDSWYEK